MAILTCENVNLSYDGNRVLSDLSFHINSGDYLCIVGENGSGKSTLVKTLLSLKKVESGSISFGDGLKQNEIGYLPQQTSAQKDFPASVWEVVISGCLNRRGLFPFYSNSEKKRASDIMGRLGLTELKRHSYRELSGGQQQRVLLARALCSAEKMILLDEPVAGLDPAVTAEMYRFIKEINKRGMTVIMVSHDISGAVRYASHILHLQGEPLFFGRTKDYINSPAGRRFLEGRHNA